MRSDEVTSLKLKQSGMLMKTQLYKIVATFALLIIGGYWPSFFRACIKKSIKHNFKSMKTDIKMLNWHFISKYVSVTLSMEGLLFWCCHFCVNKIWHKDKCQNECMVGICAKEILPLRASHSQAQPKALGLPLGTIYYHHIWHSSSIKQWVISIMGKCQC